MSFRWRLSGDAFSRGSSLAAKEIGWLPKINRISSVSGGSITAGVLALNWNQLNFRNGIADNFEEIIVNPIKNLASRTIDVSSVALGAMWFGASAIK